jgi:hypothetical protein
MESGAGTNELILAAALASKLRELVETIDGELADEETLATLAELTERLEEALRRRRAFGGRDAP